MILDGWGIGDRKKDDVIFQLRRLIGIIFCKHIRIRNFKHVEKMWDFPTGKWATRKSAT